MFLKIKILSIITVCVFLGFSGFLVHGQSSAFPDNTDTAGTTETTDTSDTTEDVSDTASESEEVNINRDTDSRNRENSLILPLGFQSIQLGMTLDGVKSALIEDPFFNFRGDPDVSLLSLENQKLIECKGNSYIARAYFQFYDDRLYAIILRMDERKIDHFSFYTRFTEKYGDPSDMNPERSIWNDGVVSLSLERPLSVKYLDAVLFEQIRSAGKAEESYKSLNQQQFLEFF